MRRVIVWFRQDLRLHDNEALQEALAVADEIVPVYVFDPRVFAGKNEYGFARTGVHRLQFVIESVSALREALRSAGNELIVRVGHPEDEIFTLATQLRTSWVFCNRERTPHEQEVQDALERKLWTIGQEMRFSRGKMLYYTSDLPFPVTQTPDAFVTFRKETERLVNVREPLPSPDRIPPFSKSIACGMMPELSTFLDAPCESKSDARGGEKAAMERLRQFQEVLSTPADDGGNNHARFAPRLSPWLAQGCLSPKTLYRVLADDSVVNRKLAAEIAQKLYYRDYLRLMLKKHGNDIFSYNGITTAGDEEEIGWDRFRLWSEARTGVPIIDAAMRQLNATGFIKARLRYLAATFLIRQLRVSWRIGASYFESMLIDYDAASNWVNWANLRGVGPDARDDRRINYSLQSRRLDPDATFIKNWIPELHNVLVNWIHEPDPSSSESLAKCGVILGKDYPRTVLRGDA